MISWVERLSFNVSVKDILFIVLLVSEFMQLRSSKKVVMK